MEEWLLSGLLLGGCAAGTLASLHNGQAARAAFALPLPRGFWKALACLWLLASLVLAGWAYGALLGSMFWLAGIALLGSAAVGLSGAWPRSAGWLGLAAPPVSALSAAWPWIAP